jgi:hypothetical protein
VGKKVRITIFKPLIGNFSDFIRNYFLFPIYLFLRNRFVHFIQMQRFQIKKAFKNKKPGFYARLECG